MGAGMKMKISEILIGMRVDFALDKITLNLERNHEYFLVVVVTLAINSQWYERYEVHVNWNFPVDKML